MDLPLKNKLEAVLFYHGGPMPKNELAKLFDVNHLELETALRDLQQDLAERGLVLIEKDKAVELATHPAAGSFIETLTKDELNKDLTPAALEILAIILYAAPISRTKIDYLRGVNSSFLLRQLLIRGLIEREMDPHDSRRFLYRPTFALFEHLGLQNLSALPDYQLIRDRLTKLSMTTENDG